MTRGLPQLKDLHVSVQRRADLASVKINAADTSRVIGVLFEELAQMDISVAMTIVGHGLKRAQARLKRLGLLALFVGLLLSTAAAQSVPAPPTTKSYYGTVTDVHDGDSLTVVGGSKKHPTTHKVRLEGIDAPEVAPPPGCKHGPGQPYGEEAAASLAEMVLDKRVHVIVNLRSHDLYGREIAMVTVPATIPPAQVGQPAKKTTLDVNRAMVASGMAWCYAPKWPAYAELAQWQQQAAANQIGLWATTFQPEAPWLWRKAQRAKAATTSTMPHGRAESAMAPILDPTGYFLYVGLGQNVPTVDWQNKKLTGIARRIRWRDFETQPGVFAWETFDKCAADAAKYDQDFQIEVYTGTNAPDWLYAMGARRLDFVDRGNEHMPVPWDPIMLERNEMMIKELGKRYNGKAHLALVQMSGPNRRSGELHLPTEVKSVRPYLSRGVQVPGYSPQVVINAWDRTVKAYAAAFPNTNCLLSASEVVKGDGSTFNSIARPVAKNAALVLGSRFVLQYASLNSKPTKSAPHLLVEEYSKAGWRTGAEEVSSSTDTAQFGTGSFGAAVNKARAAGCRYIRIYRRDDELIRGAFP